MAYGLQLHDIYKQLLMKTFGIILIIAGIAMILIRGFSVTTEKNVVDVGPLEVNKKENKWIGWPTYAGAIVAVVGVVMVMGGRKRS
jgi:drug/metabolite transporter (DMT)-like permease